MRKEGTIVRWDDAKGFGFIRGSSATQEVFLHARDFSSPTGDVPRQGLRVTFEEIHVGGKGPRAMSATPFTAARLRRGAGSPRREEVPRPTSQPRHHALSRQRALDSGSGWVFALMTAYVLALVWLAWTRQVPLWIPAASVLLNLATYFAYWQDKYAAQHGRWRIKEDTLHLWSLAGGWCGAWFAHQVLRHKSAKQSFRRVYWTTVIAHYAGALAIWWWSRTN